MTSIREWLEEKELGKYGDSFTENEIDFDVLPTLTESDLEKLGLSVGARRRLSLAVETLNGTEVERRKSLQLEPASAERRQLTVMFCDLVGSTELSQKLDPEALRELMRHYQQACAQVVEKYDGHVAQYLGDGLMVYFGWPRAHEDDAERAIRTGLEIVKATTQVQSPEPLRVRVGIATGPVVVGETGDGDASVPKIAVGETPNVAARLQGLAGADDVVLSPATHRLASGVFEYADLGSHTLKGIVEPVHAWRVRGVVSAEGRFEATRGAHLTPFVGREAEVALLMDKWVRARDGEGQVALLCGEPGIGKSRIMQVVRSRLESQPHTRLRYQCSPYHANTALFPVIEQLGRAAGFQPEDSTSTKVGKFERVVSGDGLTRALLADLVGLDSGARYPVLNMTPQKQKEETLNALVGQVTEFAERGPVLMLFEDVHWIDSTTQEALDLLVPQLADKRVLLLVTYRPEYVPPWPSSLGHVSILNLSRLGRRQVGEMVARVTGGRRLPDEIVDQIVAKTDGVPLFIEELTKTVLESGLVTEEGGVYRLAGAANELTVPSTLQDSLMARLDRLSDVREVAQIGACIGREFSYGLLAAVCEVDEESLHRALQQLVDSELVYRAVGPPEVTYTFKHALVQDAAYDSLLKSRRHQLHQRIGEVLEKEFPHVAAAQPELMFHHLSAAGLIEQSIPYAIKAGQAAMARGAPASAVTHLVAGITLLEKQPPSGHRDKLELDLRLDLGTALIFTHGWAYSEVKPNYERCRELVALSPDQEKAFNATLGLFYYYNVIDLRDEGDSVAEELLEMSTESGDEQQLLLTYQALGQSFQCRARYKDAQIAFERSLSYYDSERDLALAHVWGGDFKCMDLSMAGYAYCIQGCLDKAMALVQESEAYARMLGQPIVVCNSRLFFPVVAWMRGEYDQTIESALRARELARDNGLGLFVAYLGMYAAAGYCGVGDAKECVTMFEENDAIAKQIGARVMRGFIVGAIAPAYAEMGESRKALEIVNTTIAECQSRGDYYFDSYLLTVRALIKKRGNHDDLGDSDLHEALKLARAQSAKLFELHAAMGLARLWKLQNKTHDAYELLSPIYASFTEGLDTRHLKEAQSLLEELEVTTA